MKHTIAVLAVAAIILNLGIAFHWPIDWLYFVPVAALGYIAIFIVD